jgi:undecaprenyl-diphosphatase
MDEIVVHMTNSQAIILGFIQGLTEYIPVSSSAHLVLVPKVLGWHFSNSESFVFNVLVQLGTLVGVFGYFLRSIWGIGRSMVLGLWYGRPLYDDEAYLGYLLMIATIPAAFAGLFFKDYLAGFFSTPLPACYFLIVTGLLLVLAELLSHISKTVPNRSDAMLIGMAQGLALFPGISRSGATIAAGMFRGLSRKNAAHFSFLLSIPIIFGASLVAFADLLNSRDLMAQLAIPLILGFITAAITGYAVIYWLMAFLTNKRLSWFACYCLMVGSWGIWHWGWL